MCLITRRDPHLDTCLKSIVDHVEEICIGLNDPSDVESVAIAERHGAKIRIAVECNDEEGRIKDFSAARNATLEMATQPWICWVDSDDIVTGLDKLNDLCAHAPPNSAFMFPYEYAYNPAGQV